MCGLLFTQFFSDGFAAGAAEEVKEDDCLITNVHLLKRGSDHTCSNGVNFPCDADYICCDIRDEELGLNHKVHTTPDGLIGLYIFSKNAKVCFLESIRKNCKKGLLELAEAPPLTEGACCFCRMIPEQLRRCMGCKQMFYCSTTCQTLDWERGHKKACKILQES